VEHARLLQVAILLDAAPVDEDDFVLFFRQRGSIHRAKAELAPNSTIAMIHFVVFTSDSFQVGMLLGLAFVA